MQRFCKPCHNSIHLFQQDKVMPLRIQVKIGIPTDQFQKDYKSRLRREKDPQIFDPEFRHFVR